MISKQCFKGPKAILTVNIYIRRSCWPLGAVNLENPAGLMLIGLANTPYLVRPYIKFSIHFCPDLGHKEIAKSYTIHSTKLTHTHMRPAALWHPNRRSKNVLYGDERSTFLKMLCSTILPRALCPIAPILLQPSSQKLGLSARLGR